MQPSTLDRIPQNPAESRPRTRPAALCPPNRTAFANQRSLRLVWPESLSLRFAHQFLPFRGRHIVDRRLPAQLQRPDIGNNRPSVGDRYAIAIGVHRAKAVRDHVKKMAGRRIAQAIEMVRGWRLEAALNDDTVAVSCQSVARRAENVVSLASPIEHFAGHCKWERVGIRTARTSNASSVTRELIAAGDDRVARHRPRNRLTRRAPITEKAAGIVRVISGLNVHIEPASSERKQQRQASENRPMGAQLRHSAKAAHVPASSPNRQSLIRESSN